jgi:hypothetical protein
VVAPDAVSVVPEPAQIDTSGLTVSTGVALTVTTTVVTDEVQVPCVTERVTFIVPLVLQLTT